MRASGSASARSSRASSLIEQILRAAAGRRDPRRVAAAPASRAKASALVEGFRGDVLRLAAARRGRPRRALPSARSVLVPMAAAGGRDRGQHRRRLPALQQIVQLLLFGARSLRRTPCARSLFESLLRAPADRARRRRGRRGAGRARARALDARARQRLGRSLVDPRGRCRLLQRLRAGNPCAQQCLLRPRALRPALRRLAAPCRRAAGDRPGHQEHARGAGAHLRRDARPEMGGGGRRLRARRRHVRRQLRRASAASPASCRSTCTSAAARHAPCNCSKGCWPCSNRRRDGLRHCWSGPAGTCRRGSLLSVRP